MSGPRIVDGNITDITTTTTSMVANYPAASVSGDLLVMAVKVYRGSNATVTVTTPSGWTLAGSNDQSATNGRRMDVFWRFRGAETSVTVNPSVTCTGDIAIQVYRGDIDPAPIDDIQFNYDTTANTNVNCPSVTTTQIGGKVAYFVSYNSSLNRDTTYSFPALEITENSNANNCSIGYADFLAAGATGAVAVTLSSSISVANKFRASVAIKSANVYPLFVQAISNLVGSVNVNNVASYPPSSASGDVLLLVTYSKRASNGAFTVTTPTGWALLDSLDSSATNGYRADVFWRVRGAETSVTVTHSVAVTSYTQIHAYRGTVDPTNPIGPYSFTYSAGSSNTAVIPAITTTVNNALSLIVMGASGVSTTRTHTWPSNASEVLDTGNIDAPGSIGGAIVETTASGASTGTFTVTKSGTTSVNFMLNLAIQPVQNQTVNSDDDVAVSDDASVQATINADDSAGISAESATISVENAADDLAISSETASVAATINADDAASLSSETASVVAIINADDSITLTEDAFASNTVLETEQTTLTEGDATVEITENDAISASDTASVTASIPVDEVVALADTASVAITVDADAIAVADDAQIVQTVTDDAILTETASIAVMISASDAVTISEEATVEITAADDTITATENAVKLISGLLVTPRKVVVVEDQRRVSIPAESRRVEAVGSFRKAYMRKETQRTILVGPDKRLVTIQAEV